MNKIGFSTGSIYKIADKYNPVSFDLFEKLGKDVIEICLNDCLEVERLDNITCEVKKFSYRSIHFPSNGIIYRDDEETNKIIQKIEKFYLETNANVAIIHPDLVEDWQVFRKYNLNWAIENMDDRKESYKTVEDLKRFFEENPNWNFVLDLNHCYSNDKTMLLADDMINNFRNKIIHYHLSGCFELHDPLFETKQDFIIDYSRKVNVPIIIESVFNSLDGIEKELDYINNSWQKKEKFQQ